MTELLLGLDLGTSGLKAVLMRPNGSLIATATEPYPTRAPAPGWAEQDPDDWWRAAQLATRAALERSTGPARVAGIGLSGQMHTFVLLDDRNGVVRPAITWMDARAHDELPELERRANQAGARAALANPVVLGTSLPPLAWLARHEPDALERTQAFVLAKDHLRFRLTGDVATEATDASATGLFDVPARRWLERLEVTFGVPERILPRVLAPERAAGTLTRRAAEALGLQAGTPVAFGAGDQQAAALGMGGVTPGAMQLVVGTGAQAHLVTDAPRGDDAGRLHVFCHVRHWLAQASMNNAGSALEWVRAVLGMTWEEMYAASRRPSGGSSNRAGGEPLFLPYLAGERTPLMKPHARGAFLRVDGSHTRVDLARAALEGVALAIADGVRTLTAHAAPDADPADLRSAGGGLRDRAFATLVASACGLPLRRLASGDASGVGAALLGGVSAGTYADLEEAAARAALPVTDDIEPDARTTAALEEKRVLVESLHDAGLHELLAKH